MMESFNSAAMPNRKKIRLSGYDYSQSGVYFITMCTADRRNLLWQKSFYDHVIRDEEDYNTKWQYIDNNPLNRLDDELFIAE